MCHFCDSQISSLPNLLSPHTEHSQHSVGAVVKGVLKQSRWQNALQSLLPQCTDFSLSSGELQASQLSCSHAPSVCPRHIALLRLACSALPLQERKSSPTAETRGQVSARLEPFQLTDLLTLRTARIFRIEDGQPFTTCLLLLMATLEASIRNCKL